MVFESEKNIEECWEDFHSHLRSTQLYGRLGKLRKSSKGSVFSFYVTNRKHFFVNTREMRGRNLPIFVYLNGKVVTAPSGVTIHAGFQYGIPIWGVLLLFAITLIILLFSKNILSISELGIWLLIAMSVFIAAVPAIFSFLCSYFCLLGGDDAKELEEYLTKVLQAKAVE